MNRSVRQRAKKVAKRVRAIGVGKEKSQITVTLGANEETGKLLPTQYIFGGKTTRCHPKDPPSREGDYFTHADSHWQTPETLMEYLDKVVMPEKEAIITRLGLPVDQRMILKLDIHYSHKDPEVLALMHLMNILPIFVQRKVNSETTCTETSKSSAERTQKSVSLSGLLTEIWVT